MKGENALASQRDDKHALVVGGSISGLFAALLLARRGWRVDVYERAETPLAGRGAGIVTHPELAAAFSATGLDPSENLGVKVPGRRTLARDGRIVGEHPCPQTLTSWDRLHGLLRGSFPTAHYHLGKELRSIEQGSRVIARFADGTAAEGDLLIGADGIRSTVRACYLPDERLAYAGYVAWRGLVAEGDLSPRTHSDLFEYFAFCLPPGEQMLGYPVPGPDDDLRPGHRRYNFVWYRPADEAGELKRLLTDASGRTHSLSIPPPLIRAEAIRDMRAAAERMLAPQFQELVRLAPQPLLQPIYDFETPRMVFGRVALIGDAAFVARPHVGAGTAKAAQDAMALVEAVESGAAVESALRHFEEIRLPVGRRIIARARELGVYLQSQVKTVEERRLAEQYRTPAAVMADTAVLDFLRA